MALAILEGAGGRSAPARNVLRPAVARLVAADARAPVPQCHPCRLGLDDGGLATFGADGRAREWAGSRAIFP